MAFIATSEINESVVQIRVVRYCKSDSNGKHEMEITIADKYQQTELPSILLKALTAYAKTDDINSLYTIELRDNQHARRLAIEFSVTGMIDPNDAHRTSKDLFTLTVGFLLLIPIALNQLCVEWL